MKYDYDIVILGGGSGGITAAKVARGLGKRVALIEKNKLGGECTWTGCVPSKRLVAQAEVAHAITRVQEFGLKLAGHHDLDTSGIIDNIQKTIQKVYATETPETFEKEGITVLFGAPTFVDNHTLALNGTTVTFDKAIIATGSRPFVPSIKGLDTVSYLTNETVFSLSALPSSMIILGGGPIGAEFASALNRLGVRVTVIEMADRILLHEDKELVNLLMQKMRHEGVQLNTGLKAIEVSQEGQPIHVVTEDTQSKKQKHSAESLLVATGRRPNIEGLELDALGIQITDKGIVVNNKLRTDAKNIYACGDVVGPYLFSHMAWYQATVAVRNACIPFFKKKVSYKNRIWVTFTAPELGTSGLTEEQARAEHGERIVVYRSYYEHLDRAMVDSAEFGMLKVICNNRGTILGAHMLGKRAGDAIHEIHLARCKGIKVDELESVIHAYPTYSDLIWQVGKKAYVDRLERNPVIRLLQKVFNRSNPSTGPSSGSGGT